MRSPAGAQQWAPINGVKNVRDAHDATKFNLPVMFTTDLALKMDPIYGPISKRFHENPEAFNAAFARAWYKLTHRDMGPASRCLGPMVAPPQIWQDPVPAVDHALIDAADTANLKRTILASGVSEADLVAVAWASAASFRDSDKRGGANGARVRLAPQKDWEANEPRQLAQVLAALGQVQADFNASAAGGKQVSLADLVVLGGSAVVEASAARAGYDVSVEFVPGRMDATQEQTDVESFAPLEPMADGFRNYIRRGNARRPEEALIDRANQLALTAPEMTVLIGGLRVLGANHGDSQAGVFTSRPGTLSNDFFVNLLDMGTQWTKGASGGSTFTGTDRATGKAKWTATAVDLVFGSNSELRALAEVYASEDAKQKFVEDFAAAWSKVMHLDRFDLK